MTDTAKALSLVGLIITAYNAAEKAGADALGHALECGKHLNVAFETVGKGKWKKWRETNLPKVSEETERLYRRLAGAVAVKEDFFAKCKSIRDAMKHLSRFELKDEQLVEKPPKPKPNREETGNGVTGLSPPEPDKSNGSSVDLATLLKNVGPDEVVAALKDADWEQEQVNKLVSLLIASSKATATPPPATAQKRSILSRVSAN